MSIKAIVTGANGMLADALMPLLKNNGYDISAIDIAGTNGITRLDIRNLSEVGSYIKKCKPDIVFHLAAETNVDKCEIEREHAFETNAKGTENIALICKEIGSDMVYISTGAVFDGEKMGGYTELDTPAPISVYGMSKLKGEEAVSSALERYYIIRAGWMIGGFHKDKKFVAKIYQLLKTEKEIPVVIDKSGSPTFTKDFARGILDIVSTKKYGLYHCANKGICTRFDIAKKIAEYAGREDVKVKPVTSEVFPLPAPRGKCEGLINYNLARMGMDRARPWQDALKEYIDEVKTL